MTLASQHEEKSWGRDPQGLQLSCIASHKAANTKGGAYNISCFCIVFRANCCLCVFTVYQEGTDEAFFL